MCLGYPALVLDVDLDDAFATVVDRGRQRRASTLLLPETRAGDWVLVAAGTVVRRLEPDDAHQLIDEITRAEGQTAATTIPTRTPVRGGTP